VDEDKASVAILVPANVLILGVLMKEEEEGGEEEEEEEEEEEDERRAVRRTKCAR
jgi:hypothetical protein